MAKNILFTLFYAEGLHGGVKYSAELGQYFQTLGYNVYVAGVVTSDGAKEFFRAQNITLVNVREFPFDVKFDLVWTHHFPILPWLIRHGLKYGRVINSCISEFLPVEKPVFFVENVDLVIALTSNLRDNLVKNYGVPENKIIVLPNTAPDGFFECEHSASSALKRVAIVSNHAPQELLQARDILIQHGIAVDVFGGANPINITPDVLNQYDAVVTIGKTVQYCLAMGMPVYNYDHFGGSGYITPENIEVEAAANFSGRSFRTKKTAKQIANEIIRGYKKALRTQEKLRQYATAHYKLSARVNDVLKKLDSMPVATHVTETSANRVLFDYCDFIMDISANHVRALNNKNTPAAVKKASVETPMQRLWRHVRSMRF